MNIVVYFFIFLFGLVIGSFLNVVILRTQKKEGIGGRSYCPKCKKQIAWYDNIPVLSYLILRGECRHCKKRISIQYPIVELATGILFMFAFIFNFKTIFNEQSNNLTIEQYINLIRDLVLITSMIVIFVIDLRWYMIYDVITIPSIAIIFGLNFFLGIGWQEMLISGIIGAGFFLLQFVVSRGKWIGGGDIRLGALMGVALGWPGIAIALMLAYVIGSIVSVPLVMCGKKGMKSEIPFGVFLSTTTIITLFFGTQILDWYLNLF